jgi:cyclic pyranopterin phosphate synthase
MPADGIHLLSHSSVLTYEQLLLVAKAAVANGIEKIRVTGGEPLVRKGIIKFIEQLAVVPGLQQLVLTTNGLALRELAEPLKRAGVQRLNISLDSLQPETFASITRGADVSQVLAGIAAARQAGFPIKINMVVMRGINNAEILDFVDLTLSQGLTVRFIEYMPSILTPDWQTRVVSGESILEQVASRYTYSTQDREGAAGPARIFRVNGAAGTFGIITPITGHFCEDCNRIRVTAAGKMRGCLFADDGLDLKPYLASGDLTGLAAAMRSVVICKPKQHRLVSDTQDHTSFAMSAVGG